MKIILPCGVDEDRPALVSMLAYVCCSGLYMFFVSRFTLFQHLLNYFILDSVFSLFMCVVYLLYISSKWKSNTSFEFVHYNFIILILVLALWFCVFLPFLCSKWICWVMFAVSVNPCLLKPCGDSGMADGCPFFSYCGGCHVPDCGLVCDRNCGTELKPDKKKTGMESTKP